MLDPGIGIDLRVHGDDSAGTLTTRGVTWEEVTAGGRVYFRGRALWTATEPAQAGRFGDQWVAVTDNRAGFALAGQLAKWRFILSTVVFGPHPGLEDTGTVVQGGQRAIELRGTHDIYDVLDSATPYPLRWLDLADPGPNGTPCGVILSDFGAPVAIAAPIANAALTPAASPTPSG